MTPEEEAFLRVQAVHHAGLRQCLDTLDTERAKSEAFRHALVGMLACCKSGRINNKAQNAAYDVLTRYAEPEEAA